MSTEIFKHKLADRSISRGELDLRPVVSKPLVCESRENQVRPATSDPDNTATHPETANGRRPTGARRD
jgi:hypothetical protein